MGDACMICCLNKDARMLDFTSTVMMVPCKVETCTCIAAGGANNLHGTAKGTDTRFHVHATCVYLTYATDIRVHKQGSREAMEVQSMLTDMQKQNMVRDNRGEMCVLEITCMEQV